MKLGPVRRTLAAACLLPLLLAGCSDASPTPDIPDPTTSSPSPSADVAEAGPVEPTLPPEAEGDGVEAAEAFVTFYISTIDYAQETMEPSLMRKFSAQTCSACFGVIDLITRVEGNGGRVKGGTHTVRSLQAEELGLPGKDKAFRAVAAVRTTRQDITKSGVKDLDGTLPPQRLRYGFVLLQDQNGWRVSEWEIL